MAIVISSLADRHWQELRSVNMPSGYHITVNSKETSIFTHTKHGGNRLTIGFLDYIKMVDTNLHEFVGYSLITDSVTRGTLNEIVATICAIHRIGVEG